MNEDLAESIAQKQYAAYLPPVYNFKHCQQPFILLAAAMGRLHVILPCACLWPCLGFSEVLLMQHAPYCADIITTAHVQRVLFCQSDCFLLPCLLLFIPLPVTKAAG